MVGSPGDARDQSPPNESSDEEDEDTDMTCLLDWFFRVSGDQQETSNDDLARIINRLWQNDQFENDNSDLTPDELQAEERFKNTFS